MAITIITEPAQWARVGDTNRLTYKFSSDKYTEPNFQFQFFMLSFNVLTNDYEELGYYNLHATPEGTVEFNPSAIYANYLSYDFDITITGLTEMVYGAHNFQLYCYEYYGTPPTTHIQDGRYTTILHTYNGVQQNIPYDYTPLNADGNLKWVMSRISGHTGQFLTDATEFKLSNEDYGFLYALGEHYNLGRPNKIRYTIAYAPIGEQSGYTTSSKYLNENIYYYNTNLLTSGTTYTITSGYAEVWEDPATFANMMPSPFTWDTNWFGYSGNTAIIKFKNCWMTYSSPYYPSYNINTIIKDTPSYEQSVPNPSQKVQAMESQFVSNDYPRLLRYDTGITILYDLRSIGYYIPIGPGNQPDNILSGLTDTWIYYDIDLIYNTVSGDTILNNYPIRVYKGCFSDKYDKWQLFWLNPHGGFDTYIFNKKTEINYKIKKSTYKQKIPPTFSPYTAGEKVFNVNVEEEITLRSDLLTQKESQLLTQLVYSPVVYALKYYLYNDVRTYFVVPYIITTDDWKYEQKKNDKEIFVELKMRASNSKILQKN